MRSIVWCAMYILIRKTGFSLTSATSSIRSRLVQYARWVATGTLLYSMFSLIEGFGLIFRAPWAGWLAIGESAFFIPIEIFELIHHHAFNHPRPELLSHPKLGLLAVLAFNVLIVWYLYANRTRLFRHRHGLLNA